eukprot:XP_008756808.2 PREDICTED: vomeronasal type-2 receptor 116-like [Rattus norvegicus]
MKKLCAFTIAFFPLKFCLILCSLTEPNCFWRIKKIEVYDGDLQNDCGFVLFTLESPIEENFYNHIINFRIPARKYEFFLVMFFATDEINKNPYLLSNMSLIFSFIFGMCEDTMGVLDKAYLHQNNYFDLLNYNCGRKKRCDVKLTGPSWKTSLKLSVNSRAPKVIMCDTGRITNFKFHLHVPTRKLGPHAFIGMLLNTHIFFGPFNPNLSDHDQFPYIYQIATKDTYLLHGMVSLMFHFEWTWIGLIITDDDQESIKLYNTKFKIYDQQLMTSSAKVTIIYGKMISTLELNFARWTYLVARRIWITTSKLDVITYDKDFSLDFFHGTVIFAHHHNDIATFRNFMQIINTSKYPAVQEKIGLWNICGMDVNEIMAAVDGEHYLQNMFLEMF